MMVSIVFQYLMFYWLIQVTLSFFIKPFQANVPLMEKPGGWFLLAKCVKNTSGRVTF